MPSATKTVPDATCTHCGCTCDDIELTVDDQKIIAAERACDLGKAWFLGQEIVAGPSCHIEGEPASIEEGSGRAAEILGEAKYPLIFGLEDATCETQRIAAGIADWSGACIDVTARRRHGAATIAMQSVGQVTATLGEIANRGDLVIFWGADPAEKQPRHFERYSMLPESEFLPGGRADRTCVVIDSARPATAEQADLFLQIDTGKNFEALAVLRALVKGIDLDAKQVDQATGVSLSEWQSLVERMKAARYGAIFYGPGSHDGDCPHGTCAAMFSLVCELNYVTRFVIRSIGAHGNPIGGENVLAWRTGFPFAVNHARGYPRFSPVEYTAHEILARREADAALIVSASDLANLEPAAREFLDSIPRVVLTSEEIPESKTATVAFTVATYGVSTGGTVYRVDDVPLSLRPALDSPHPAAEVVLSQIERRVKEQDRNN